jgi:arylsulfatase A-like enzyme
MGTMHLSRRHFFFGSANAPLLAQRRRAVAERPNVLLILADDLAAWMLGCYGNQEIRTPHIDRLAAMGTRFTHNFVCTPICSASRATLFTGRVPRQHGIHDFLSAKPIDQPPQGQAAPPPSFSQEVMLSDILAGQGYECGYLGKWHMGNDQQPQHGHRFWYTTLAGRYTDPQMSWNGAPQQEKGYLAELLTAKAGQFLDQQTKDKPFFLTVSYFNPHVPYEGHPQKYYDLYAKTSFDTVGWEPAAPNALREKNYLSDIVGNLRKAAAATTALDDQIPGLLNKLRERGLFDNTLVVFTGDNGFLLGRHGLWSKGLASDPINMYEEVMQVPMIWAWPGKIPVQHTPPELVSFYDFVPSVCDLLGVAPPDRKLTGRSYLPLATGKQPDKKEPWKNLVFGHFRNTEMARDARYKLVLRNGGEGPNELYDLRADAREKVNQYENPAFVNTRDRLTKELTAWRARTA